MNIKQALAFAAQSLAGESARRDAEVLLAACLERDRTYLYTWPERLLSDTEYDRWLAWVAQRKLGVPVAYILGEKEFWSLPLYVNESTLIPRPETETLVEVVLARFPDRSKKLRLLDLGTGTGAIALALASELPGSDVLAVDIQFDAVQLAIKNRDRLGLTNVSVAQSTWFAQVSGQFDVIVSNPPYIEPNDPHLNLGDVRFEPRSALIAEESGLRDLRWIVTHAHQHLVEGGKLFLEHGYDQSAPVQRLLRGSGYTQVTCHSDLAGQPRVSEGTKL